MTTPRSAIPPLLKQLNERTVLETIRSAAPISRAEISRQAGISKPTVSLALQSLLESGLVRETEPEVGRPRYGAVFFEAVPDAALVLGVDIGARFLRGAICDLSGAVRARQDVELPDVEVGKALDTITKLRTSLVDASGLPAHLIDSAVVGVPAVVDDETGRLSMATNVPGLEGGDFRTDLVERLDLPVTLDNDINLAARGEQWRGVARGIEDFVFLSVGTGLGAGLVLRGELHRGRNGAAGEVDLVASGRADEIDPCAAAVAELTAQLAAEGVETQLTAPSTRARSSARPGRATRSGGPSWKTKRAGSRCTSRRLPPSRTSRWSCSAAASARTGTCSSIRSGDCSPSGCRSRRASRCRASATRQC